jgi:hypothetical protein
MITSPLLPGTELPTIREQSRSLKPGSRWSFQAILLIQEATSLPAPFLPYLGTFTADHLQKLLTDHGFESISFDEAGLDLNYYVPKQHRCQRTLTHTPVSEEDWIASTQGCCGIFPHHDDPLDDLLDRYDVNQFAKCVQVEVVKG